MSKSIISLAYAIVVALPALVAAGRTPSCRFALEYSQQDILHDPDSFINDYLYWEGKFHQNDIAYNLENGMSYDGSQIDWDTGIATIKHNFSAASKESLQFMLYAQAISGSQKAAQFLSPNNPSAAPDIAVSILELKLQTYLRFNETYPGFGGLLPWVYSNATDIEPSADYVNLLPGLDNGELLWAAYGAVQALSSSSKHRYRSLAEKWASYLDYTKMTAAKIFYSGNGTVCTVMAIANQSWPVDDPRQTYTCETDAYLNDPYEGELFTWWLYFYGNLEDEDRNLLWEVKRPQLVSMEYVEGSIGPITVQEGYWFSSHEQWKTLEMPYYDVAIVHRVFTNAERVRTCNSVLTSNPGMFASINNITNTTTDEIIGYISNAGIPSISSQTDQELDVITPYGVFPTILIDKKVRLAWLRNMLVGKKMQNPYGSTEGSRIDGTGVSALLTWDSKMTTVNSILGGVQDLVRQGLKKEGLYEEFIYILDREYSRVFPSLKGEDISLCLPVQSIPDVGLTDFTECI